ncbi:MAG: C1 family peptidase [Clostridia bacterium]|nr:C1 family peptidase [Clostridia bacterium]MBR1586613.1 C1 family peptidase [Clostridia bacterium]
MKKTPITLEQLEAFSRQYQSSPARQLATLALSKTDLSDAAYAPQAGFAMRQKFSLEIPTLPVANQQKSGRCWLFAAANVLRESIAKKLNLKSFELSQSYLAFWDKFERANYFLESILETAYLPTDDRTVAFLLTTGVHDGGQWDMFANIVRKYGVVPKDVYDETFQSCNTRSMNHILNRNLKICAVKLRKMAADGADDAAIQDEKARMLDRIYGFLCACYTEPPKTFDFEYVDVDRHYHIEKGLTPAAFRDRYVGDLLDRTVSVIHAPTADKPYHKTFTVNMLGNVVGGRMVKHLNLPMEEMKQAIIRQLEAGKVVWFGSDVGKFGLREAGVWDDQCFQYELLTGLDLTISKEDSLNYWFAAMNHAMVITGVNLVDGKPTRWKIENSWGDQNGEKGYYVCSDSWFDAYVFQAAIEKEYLGDLAAFYDLEPIALAPWDPMGTLAD